MAAPGVLDVDVLELEALGSPKMSVNGSELGVAAGVLALPDAPALLLAAGVDAAGAAVLALLLLFAPPAPAEAVPLVAAGVAAAAAAVLAGVGLVSAGLLLTAAAGAAVAATLGLVVGAATMGLGLPAVIGTAGLPAAPELAVGASLLQAAASASQTRQSARCWELRKETFGISQYSHGASRLAPAWTTGVLLSTLWVIRRDPPKRSWF